MTDNASDATNVAAGERVRVTRNGSGWTTTDRLSTAVVNAVSDATGRAPSELEPLYTRIDPDALDVLFERTDSSIRPTGRVIFTYAGCEVRVSGESMDVVPLDESATGSASD